MKCLNFMFLVIVATLIFSSCSKDDLENPVLNTNDQETSYLKSAKEEMQFSGISSFFAPGEEGTTKLLPNEKMLVKGGYVVWYDVADDPLLTGKTTWYVKQKVEADGAFKFWGKTELILDNDLGRWDMSWKGYLTFTPIGPVLTCDVVGQGKEGEVKGLVAKWVYTFDFVNGNYTFEGNYH